MDTPTDVPRIGFDEFMHRNAAQVARSSLEGYSKEILAALASGATYAAVAAWLAHNDVKVTRQALQQWVKRRQQRSARRVAELYPTSSPGAGEELSDCAPAGMAECASILLSAMPDEILRAELHRRSAVAPAQAAAATVVRLRRSAAVCPK